LSGRQSLLAIISQDSPQARELTLGNRGSDLVAGVAVISPRACSAAVRCENHLNSNSGVVFALAPNREPMVSAEEK
jgi:hypothetical protein